MKKFLKEWFNPKGYNPTHLYIRLALAFFGFVFLFGIFFFIPFTIWCLIESIFLTHFYSVVDETEEEEEEDDGVWFDENQAWFPDARSSEEATTYWASRIRKL